MEDSLVHIRLATESDRPAIEALHRNSVLSLNGADYTPGQLGAFLQHIGTYDPQIITDRSYFVAEVDCGIVGSGGWSWRTPDLSRALESSGPATIPASTTLSQSAAKIRSIFVHPDWTRRGIASRLVANAECAAAQAGYTAFELIATLTAVPLYRGLGYEVVRQVRLFSPDGEILAAVHMAKQTGNHLQASTAA